MVKASEFNDFILTVQDRIFRLSLALLQEREAARDALQEVIIKLWNKRNMLNSLDNPAAYALVTTRNHCLDQLRLRRLDRDGAESWPDREQDPSPIPQRSLELKEATELVFQLISQLPVNQKTVFHLRDVEGYSTDEIASVMETTDNNVRVMLARARATIREQMEKIYSYEYTAPEKDNI